MHLTRYVNRTSTIFFIFLFLTLSLYGCTNLAQQKAIEKPEAVRAKDVKREIILSTARNFVVIYFTTADSKNLIPVTIDVNPTQEMAKVAVEKLLAGPPNESLANALPEGTKLKDLYKFQNIAYVDLTEEFLKAKDQTQAALAVQALLFTLTEFQQVDSIQILVGGKVPTENYGGYDITKTLHRPKIINFYDKERKNVYKVYYTDLNAQYMVPVTFTSDKSISAEQVIKKLLQDPPKQSNLNRAIWPNTKLLGIEIKDDTAYINLSKEVLAYGGGAASELNLLNSLVYTATELPEVRKVQLLVEGKTPEYLPEGTDTSTPWERPDKINYIQKQ